jgi:mono/diheme cytochrome c family protein
LKKIVLILAAVAISQALPETFYNPSEKEAPAQTPKKHFEEVKSLHKNEKETYIAYCAACHGENAQGSAGPNIAGTTAIGNRDKMCTPPSIISLEDLEKIKRYLSSL